MRSLEVNELNKLRAMSRKDMDVGEKHRLAELEAIYEESIHPSDPEPAIHQHGDETILNVAGRQKLIKKPKESKRGKPK